MWGIVRGCVIRMKDLIVMGAAYGIGNCCEIFRLKPLVNYPSTVLSVQRFCCALIKSFWRRIQVKDEHAGEERRKENQCTGG